ncbi:MAG: transmembrane amino acid transporter protein-domain-containing protein, partial [Olpidium bornovanus]
HAPPLARPPDGSVCRRRSFAQRLTDRLFGRIVAILVARHLVTPGSPTADDDPGGNDAFSFPVVPDAAGVSSSSAPDSSAERREEQQHLRPARRGEGGGGAVFSTSHQRVGGEVVRDIYKFVENGADASVRKRSKSYGDIHGASPGRAHSRPSSADVPSSGSVSPARLPSSLGRSPPSASATMPDITVPGGFRRHFVRTRAKSGVKPRAVVTKDFLDFLSLYGHFAGGYLEDEDDEDASEEGYLPFAEPGLPPLPPRVLSERSPLVPSVGHPGGSEYPGGTASARKAVFLLLKSFVGTGVLFLPDFQVLANTGMAPVRNFNDANFSLFIGTAVFTFEGIGLVLPIADSMEDPAKFPRVLALTTLSVTVLFTCVGALSYAAFGDEVQTVILLNLPAADPLVRAVQALYSFAIVFSVPLQ